MNNRFYPSIGFCLIIATVVVVLSIITWSFSNNNIEQFEKTVEKANTAFYQKDFEKAMLFFEQAANLHFDHTIKAKVFSAAAEMAMFQQDFNKASHYLTKSLFIYALNEKSWELFINISYKMESDLNTANFIHTIGSIENFPEKILIKAVNNRLSKIKTQEHRLEFIKLLNDRIKQQLEINSKEIL